MRYFIVGYPKTYNMQYGIYDYQIIELKNFDEAKKLGAQISREVINEFCHPSEEWYTTENYLEDNNIETWTEEYEEAYNATLNNIIENEVAYKIWEVKSDTTEEAIRLWANSEDNIENFVQRYCINYNS